MSPYKYHLAGQRASLIPSSLPVRPPDSGAGAAVSSGQAVGPLGRPTGPRARTLAQTIIARAHFLCHDERVLVQAIYEQGLPAKEVAAISGQPLRLVRDRVRLLRRRMRSPEFDYVAVHQDEWSATMRAVARECILRGHSIRRAAADLRISAYRVRRHRDLVMTLCQESVADARGRRGAPAS